MPHEMPEAPAPLPAIVITGPEIAALSPIQRLEAAAQAAALVGPGATAQVVEAWEQPEGTAARQTESKTPPLTLLMPDTDDYGYDPWYKSLALAADQRVPGFMEHKSGLVRVVNGLIAEAYWSDKSSMKEVLTYRRGEPDKDGKMPVYAMTFENPDAMLRHAKEIANGVNNVGIKGMQLLHQFIRAMTTTVIARPGSPPINTRGSVPFSLRIPDDWYTNERRKALIQRTVPEIIGTPNERLLLQALYSLFDRPISLRGDMDPDMSDWITYHTEVIAGHTYPRGITFVDPQTLVEHPSRLRALHQVGPARTRLLARFIAAAGQLQPKPPGSKIG
jgi:hypothetical protein